MQNQLGLSAKLVENLYHFGVDDIQHYIQHDGTIDKMVMIEDITDGLNDEGCMKGIEEKDKQNALDVINIHQKQHEHEQQRAEEREQQRAQQRAEEREQRRAEEREQQREQQRIEEEKEATLSTYFVLTGKQQFSPQREDFVQYYSRSKRQWISKIVTGALPEKNCVFLEAIAGSISLERIRPDITTIKKVKDEKTQREEEHKFQHKFIPNIEDFVEYYSLTLQEWIECSVTEKRKDGDQYYFDISRGLHGGIKSDVSLNRIRPVSQSSLLYKLQKHYSADGVS